MLLVLLGDFGEVGIAPWEYLLAVVYAIVLYVVFARKKNLNFKLHPEYRYYLKGLWLKLFGSVLFALIYVFYYEGGDTISYFYSGIAMKGMLSSDPVEYFKQVIMGDNSLRALNSYGGETIRPWGYIFNDKRTFQVARISSLLSIPALNSFLLTTLLLASLSYAGAWACYRTFVSYFPEIPGKLAIAFLFMPSVIFWGSGIMKDTLTFSAVCGWVYAMDELVFKRRNAVSSVLVLILSAWIMIQIKPYIVMVIIPATLLWIFYLRVVKIRNVLIRFVLLPILGVFLISTSVFILGRMGDMLDKFALDEALTNIENIQFDMMNNEQYGSNKFDIGDFDGTWWGVVQKFPAAVGATLFRPYLWESSSVVIALSGLENLFILALTLFVLLKAGPSFTLRCIVSNPLLLMSMTFSLLFAFVVGVSTANFGALVRFKIPMLPFYISTLFIVLYLNKERNKARIKGVPFDLSRYRTAPQQRIALPKGWKAKGKRF